MKKKLYSIVFRFSDTLLYKLRMDNLYIIKSEKKSTLYYTKERLLTEIHSVRPLPDPVASRKL